MNTNGRMENIHINTPVAINYSIDSVRYTSMNVVQEQVALLGFMIYKRIGRNTELIETWASNKRPTILWPICALHHKKYLLSEMIPILAEASPKPQNTGSSLALAHSTETMAAAAAAAAVSSIDLAATTLLGLAKRQAANKVGIPSSVFSLRRHSHHFSISASRPNSMAIQFVKPTSPNRSSFLKLRRQVRSFAASGAATESDAPSDVLTKIPPDDRIPATIITGFLGSGKTTLLNYILTANHGKRIAVIENEFGEVDIDGSLVAAQKTGAEDIVMLNNGCLCCTVRGDLVRMISELVDKKKGKFDHLVIETTGLANPAPIIQTFYAEDSVFNDVKLDGVVTLVDAKHADFHLDEIKPKGIVNEAVEQIAYADRIIVNKTDLVDEPQISSLIQRIKNINQMAHLKRTAYGKVELDYVLGIGGFDLERIESAVDAKSEDSHAENDHHHHHDHEHHHHEHHDHKHDHHAHDHTHDPGVSSVSIVCEGSLDLEKANIWLGTLLLERSDDIYRMKGLLSVEGMNERFVFQGVHDIFQGSPDRLWGQDEPRINKIVFIGKNLDREEIEKGFKSCLL